MHSAFVRFPGLLHEMGLSGHREEALSVKLEVDTRPPQGAGLETTVVRRHLLLRLQHHDRASLLAGKLHAILQRPWPKGRDFYDLVWYLSDPAWPAPNLVLLNNALAADGVGQPAPHGGHLGGGGPRSAAFGEVGRAGRRRGPAARVARGAGAPDA